MLKDVGMEAKIVEMRKHPCRKWDDGIQIAHRWDDGMQTLAQVSETARTGAAAGHSRENGRECCYTPLWGALPLLGPQPPPPPHFLFCGVTHVIIVACHHPLFAARMLPRFYTFWYFHPYIPQEFFILVEI